RVIFFFQAEDGIRDYKVTGVQTCALPILCCLRYEHDFYVQTRKRFPKEGKVLRTGVGPERVLAVDIFRETVTLRSEGGGGDTRVVSLEKLKDEIARSGGDA